jgi:hypothetical protein
MKKLVFSVAVTALMTGCATVKVPLNANTAAALKNQSIVETTRKAPTFVATVPGPAILAMSGVDKVNTGEEIVKDNDIADPAIAIRQALLKELQSAHAVQPVASAVLVDSANPEKMAASAKGAAKYILDVETTYWSFLYFPTDWSHYRIMYTADARLIDADSKKVVAESHCSRIPEFSPSAPTYPELVDNQAQRLKTELKLAADTCSALFKTEMLAL